MQLPRTDLSPCRDPTVSHKTPKPAPVCFVFQQVELQRAVQECSETDEGEDKEEEDDGGGGVGGGRGEKGRGRDIHHRLLNILTRLLQEGGASSEGGGSWEGGSHSHTALNF